MYYKKRDSRDAYVRRLYERYWTNKTPEFRTRIGDIFEIDFGENIGSEFSGRHLGICLTNSRVDQDKIAVIPLSTKIEKYNLREIVSINSFIENRRIHAGIVLNEVKVISKLRIFKTSTILHERGGDPQIRVGKIKLSSRQVKKYMTIGGL